MNPTAIMTAVAVTDIAASIATTRYVNKNYRLNAPNLSESEKELAVNGIANVAAAVVTIGIYSAVAIGAGLYKVLKKN